MGMLVISASKLFIGHDVLNIPATVLLKYLKASWRAAAFPFKSVDLRSRYGKHF